MAGSELSGLMSHMTHWVTLTFDLAFR